ncbi:MAG: hypothetical protein K2K94_03765, partial [Muribaculaceae bacterium]|nr:hypothetical protein [Muribaculaceae bacterium]
MKQYFALLIIFALSQLSVRAQIIFHENAETVITVTPPASTGLEAIYVLPETTGVAVSFSGASSAKWSTYGSNGAAYAEPIATANSITLNSKDCGYIVEIDGKEHYFWIVNYANHFFEVNSFQPDL